MGEPIEERMMSEYVALNLADRETWVHLRLGWPVGVDPKAPDADTERRLKLSTLPEADVVTRENGKATIYEFKVRREQQTLGQLLYYRAQLPKTPGWEDIDPANVDLVIVTGREDPRVSEQARALGIREVEFRPAWLVKALAERTGVR